MSLPAYCDIIIENLPNYEGIPKSCPTYDYYEMSHFSDIEEDYEYESEDDSEYESENYISFDDWMDLLNRRREV